MITTANNTMFTAPEVAARYRVNLTKVNGWIRTGVLRAIDISQSAGKRPRYRVPLDAIEAFDASRSVVPPPPVPRTRHRRQDATPDYLADPRA